MRVIDADALKERAKEMEIFMPYGGDGTTMAVEVYSIDNMPTLDYAPVRHGEWVTKPDGFIPADIYCSECGKRYNFFYNPNYCPNCGALMDGGKKDG